MSAPLKVGVVGMGSVGNLHADCHKADELAELARSATS